jgi:integrase
MARIRLRFVNSFINKNREDGRVRYYFRRGRTGKAIPLPGIPGDEQFMSAYHAALASTSNAPVEIGAGRTAPGTIDALIVNYYGSPTWTDLPPDTRKNRRPIIERFRSRHGNKRVALLRRDHFETMLKELTAGPATRDYWLRTVRALMQSGIPSMIKDNPTAGIKVKRPKTEGHWTWEPQEIEQYRAHHPLGTEARLVLEFALGTASRRGEIIRLGPQHIQRGQNGEWRIKIARIKGSNPVDIPMPPELLAACQEMPKMHLTYIVSETGKPISKITLGHRFAKWATEAGLPARCRMHGLKKSSLCSLVLAGATAPEFMAISGHKDMGVAQRYIEKAINRPELADAAMAKLQRSTGPKNAGRAASSRLSSKSNKDTAGPPVFLENKKRLGVTPDYTNGPQQLHKRPAKPLKSKGA